MAKLRVMMLIDSLATGGAEDFATQLAIHLDPERFETTFCVSRWSQERAEVPAVAEAVGQLEEGGVEVMTLERPLGPGPDLPWRKRLSLTAWRPLLDRLRKDVDVLHAHKFGSNLWGAGLGTLARVPVVVAHEQTWSYEGQPARKFLDRELISRQADAFICVSEQDRQRMIEIERIDPAKIVLVRNAVPAPQETDGAPVRAELGIDDTVKVIGTLCRLSEQKALDVLLRAAKLLTEQVPGVRTLIAGDGPEQARLESLTRELGLTDSVTFLGRRTDVAEVFAAFDVAVLSSDYEGTPLALMECMGVGRPIVATRVGGVPEMIEDGIHGLLVPPQDPGALSAAIAALLRDSESAEMMGERARERREEEFDVGVAASRIGALYERLYAASKRGRDRGDQVDPSSRPPSASES
jgi:glycosyltransferase involved in cell wall biosynthesis